MRHFLADNPERRTVSYSDVWVCHSANQEVTYAAFLIQASKMVDRMFPQADTDKDDQISFEEFKKWAPHDPKMKAIMRLLGPVG